MNASTKYQYYVSPETAHAIKEASARHFARLRLKREARLIVEAKRAKEIAYRAARTTIGELTA